VNKVLLLKHRHNTLKWQLQRLGLLLLVLALTPFAVSADTQRILDYQYDAAGNMLSVRANRNLGPPDVTLLSPAFAHKENFAQITATGSNLLLTPRVVKNQHDARLVTQDFKAKLSGIYEQFESGKKTNASD
jgi:hypothetical protein